MKYEIHITVKIEDVQKFIFDCKSISLKPILIDTQTDGDIHQMMTSDKYEGDSYQEQLSKSVNNLISLGYLIIRTKVEIIPYFINHLIHSDHIYYESHVRFRFPKNYDKINFINYCEVAGWHPSKNLFKSDVDWDYQMATLRDKDRNLEIFKYLISQFVKHPMFEDLQIKTEIEECIHDTNVNIDDTWLKINI